MSGLIGFARNLAQLVGAPADPMAEINDALKVALGFRAGRRVNRISVFEDRVRDEAGDEIVVVEQR